MLKRFGSKESVQYEAPPSKHIFDYNYQKYGILNLIDLLKRNDNTSAKIKNDLVKKAQETLGLRVLPSADRVIPFFHLDEGEFSVTFLYNDPPSTPWNVVIANNFGDLVPLYKQVYDLIRTPSVNSSIPTIGTVNVFHNRVDSTPMLTNGISKHLPPLEGPMDDDVEVVLEDPSSHDLNELALMNSNGNEKRITKTVTATQSARASALGTRSSGKSRRRTITRQVTMSASMPTLKNLNTSDFEHPYDTRRKNSSRSSFLYNQSHV